MLSTILGTLDWLGIVVFAISGALVASRKEMDIFGFALLATVTGIGGGTIRDLLLGATPVFWVKEPGYVIVCVMTSIVVFFTAHIPESRYRVLLWFDAIGLAVFAVVAAERTIDMGHASVIAVVMGIVTATFGGIARDVLGGEVPLLLRKDVYVTAALVGATALIGGIMAGLPRPMAVIIAIIAGFAVRALALIYNWSLPAYRSRPGRPQAGN
jgi:uncharacterized membrane protein YeiH